MLKKLLIKFSLSTVVLMTLVFGGCSSDEDNSDGNKAKQHDTTVTSAPNPEIDTSEADAMVMPYVPEPEEEVEKVEKPLTGKQRRALKRSQKEHVTET